MSQVENPTITAIITTYKRPKLLKRAVESILKQTYPHFKLYVYDNASGDETSEIMTHYASKDSRITYHCHSENIGMMGNYQYAFSNISTPFFSFLSDDDYVLPWFFETAMNEFKKYPDAAFTACGVLVLNNKGQPQVDPLSNWQKEGYYPHSAGLYEMLSANNKFPLPTGILFQLDKVKHVKPELTNEMQIMWDPDYLIQISAQNPVAINKKISAFFFAHDEGYSSNFYNQLKKSTKFLDDYLIAMERIIEKVEGNNLINSDTKSYTKTSLKNIVRNEFIQHMKNFSSNRNIRGFLYTYKLFIKKFGFNKKTTSVIFLHALYVRLPFLKPIWQRYKKLMRTEKKSQDYTDLINSEFISV